MRGAMRELNKRVETSKTSVTVYSCLPFFISKLHKHFKFDQENFIAKKGEIKLPKSKNSNRRLSSLGPLKNQSGSSNHN